MSSIQTPAGQAVARYRDRVMACWLGKAVGGTLGMPIEGQEGPFDLAFYNPVPTTMLPNDDLDLQVVWACVLDKMADKVAVDRHVLGQAWLDHVQFPWCEYGVAIRNLTLGLKAPLTGTYDNYFADSMGAPIRSEIWACLAPGNPKAAAAYAYEDACVDHAGDGIWSEVFLAALESAAFVESDPDALIDGALSFLPPACRTRSVVTDTRRWFAETRDWRAVRERILERYDSDNFTDSPMNIGFTVLGWLASKGDFSDAICIAVNCGKDTDCTGATVGSILGIIDPDCIPERWLAPIGRSLVLSKGIVGLDAPASLDGLTDLVLDLAARLGGRMPDVKEYAQSTAHLTIPVQRAFVDKLPTDERAPQLPSPTMVRLPGNHVTMPAAAFEKPVMLLRYEFRLDRALSTTVMMNARGRSRVWVDGAFAFGREGGIMMPSPHIAPVDQKKTLDLSAGCHEIVVAIEKAADGSDAEWVTVAAEGSTQLWLPYAFLS